MYYTHYFSNLETLARARTWLSQLGLPPESIEAHTDGIPRITVAINPTQWSGYESLISAVERSDPQGWPGYWELAQQPHVYPLPLMGPSSVEAAVGTTAIGWHPPD